LRSNHAKRAKIPKNTRHQRSGEPGEYIPRKDEDPKKTSLLGRKKIASQEVTSVMMHYFFELSRHPLQG
jgi:hypothetical protein